MAGGRRVCEREPTIRTIGSSRGLTSGPPHSGQPSRRSSSLLWKRAEIQREPQTMHSSDRPTPPDSTPGVRPLESPPLKGSDPLTVRGESWFTSFVAYRPTARTEARRLELRARIAGAALEIVAEGGYAAASVQAVAARAGVAVGSVYRHFPSKSALFAEVFRRASQRELDVLADMAERPGSVAERVAAGAEAFARRALAGRTLAYALLAEPVDPAVEAERLEFRRGYRDVFARVLRDGVESGELRTHDTETLAAALVGGLGEALVGPLSPASNGRGSHEALIASLVQFTVEALPTRATERAAA